jgi:DnaJ domain
VQTKNNEKRSLVFISLFDGSFKKDKESGQTFTRSDVLAVPGIGESAGKDRFSRHDGSWNSDYLDWFSSRSIDFHRAMPQNEPIGAGTVVRFAAAKNGSERVCMKKDYYLTLRLTPEGTEREIRSAYRRLAIEIHPDHSDFSSDPFLELQEAHSVLSDPMRRADYDREVGEIPVRRTETARPTKITRRQSAAAFSPLRPIGESKRGSSETFHPAAGLCCVLIPWWFREREYSCPVPTCAG